MNRPLLSLLGVAAVVLTGACASAGPTAPDARTMEQTLPLAATTGDLAMIVLVPESTPAAVRVDGPDGFSRRLTGTGIMKGLAPGSYTIAAELVTSASGVTYVPASTVQTTSIAVGVATVVTVEYAAIAMRTHRAR